MLELNYAKSIFQKEIEGLDLMMQSLDESFTFALDILYRKDGHIIVSGMGKPGHIGRKISATLASTGSPSFFLHPAEASHGDLGEISSKDVLLVLSLSGNTQELSSILSYASRFHIDIVGITRNKDSALANASTVTILMPSIHEACPYDLAPTTTSTVMLAIGDAIALCLLRRREFSRDDFKNLHPGGMLGKRLLKVVDLMHTDLPLVGEKDHMKDVLIEMTQKSFGCAGVIQSDGALVGIITDGDLRRNICSDFLEKSASAIMSINPKVVTRDVFAEEATYIMNKNRITSLFVIDQGKPVGIIHIHDCLRAGLA